MPKVREVFEYLCTIAPLELQMDFDNSGFQIARPNDNVTCVLLALDVTDEVVEEAIEIGAQLIISHHPLIFHAVKSINQDNCEGHRLLRLAESKISVISMHTNLDIADGGVNDVLMKTLGGSSEGTLDSAGCGRIGRLDTAVSMRDFLSRCSNALETNGLRFYDAGKKVYKLAVMGGSGGDSVEDAYIKGCDTYLTSDIKYHQFQRAAELGINLIDADHFSTENPVIPVLCDKLKSQFNDIEFNISQKHKALIDFA